jgi:hypothetical protein
MYLPRAAPPRIVAAVNADVRPRIRAILPGCELRFVQTGSELVRALEEAQCTLMIVEVHFDESSALAALKCVLAREESFPVVCVRGVSGDKPGYATLNALRVALGAVVVREFIDLVEHCDDEIGNACVRAMLMQLLAAESPAKELSEL